MAKKKKRRVIPINELGGELFIELVTEGTALACALIVAAHVENALGSLLTKVLIPDAASDRLLNNPLAILSTASGRADMCYCLGLIDEPTYKNAKQIAVIRNQFAHSHRPIDFDDPDVKRLCSALRPPQLVGKDDKAVVTATSDKLLSAPRQKFVITASATFITLAIVSLYSKSQTPPSHNVRGVISEDETSVVAVPAMWNWNE
jgi:DNA-binding MltR family transcriptional regulator